MLQQHTRASYITLSTCLFLTTVLAWCPPDMWESSDGRCHDRSWWDRNRNRPWPWEAPDNRNQDIYRGPGQTGYDWNAMPGYTRENNPGYFFYGKGTSQWIDPFKGRRDVPYINVDWQSAAKMRIAHGILAAAAVVVFFPIGAIFMALFPGGTGLIMHVFFQAIGWAALLTAAIIGIWMAATIQWEFYNLFSNYHVIIGLIVFAFVILQPISGALGHRGWQRLGLRTGAGSIHVWLGRIAIVTGMINGGLGLYISGNTTRQQRTVYAFLAGLAFLVWFIAALIGMFRYYRRDVPVRPRVQKPSMVERVTWRFRR